MDSLDVVINYDSQSIIDVIYVIHNLLHVDGTLKGTFTEVFPFSNRFRMFERLYSLKRRYHIT